MLQLVEESRGGGDSDGSPGHSQSSSGLKRRLQEMGRKTYDPGQRRKQLATTTRSASKATESEGRGAAIREAAETFDLFGIQQSSTQNSTLRAQDEAHENELRRARAEAAEAARAAGDYGAVRLLSEGGDLSRPASAASDASAMTPRRAGRGSRRPPASAAESQMAAALAETEQRERDAAVASVSAPPSAAADTPMSLEEKLVRGRCVEVAESKNC